MIVRAAGGLVDLVEDDDGVADPGRPGSGVRRVGRQPADGGLDPNAAQGHERGGAQDRRPGGGPGGAHDEAAWRGGPGTGPAAGPVSLVLALHRSRRRRQLARGLEPADPLLDGRAARVRGVQPRHRRLHVHPFTRSRVTGA